MKTTEQWWNEVKADEALLIDWLKKQYHGEATAAGRIRELVKLMDEDKHNAQQAFTLGVIAKQEEIHAEWVGNLLRARGVKPELLEKDERYWSETLEHVDTFESGCAVAAHAEAMRLERIKTIASDLSGPDDIRETFRKILPDEEFHARAFRSLTTAEDLVKTNEAHVRGLEAIGLIL